MYLWSLLLLPLKLFTICDLLTEMTPIENTVGTLDRNNNFLQIKVSYRGEILPRTHNCDLRLRLECVRLVCPPIFSNKVRRHKDSSTDLKGLRLNSTFQSLSQVNLTLDLHRDSFLSNRPRPLNPL